VHGQRHRLRGHGAGYSISLHARAVPPGPAGRREADGAASANARPALSK